MNVTTFCLTADEGWAVPMPSSFDPSRTLVVAFGDPAFIESPEPIRRLAAAYSGAFLQGCSSSGEIFGTNILDHSLVVGVVEFEQTRLKTAAVNLGDFTDSFLVGKVLAEQLVDPSLRAILVFSDGLRVNGSELVRGLNAILPPSVVVTGGLAGDGDRFTRTWVLNEGAPTTGYVTAVGFYGDAVRVGHGSKGGWDCFGPERRVTRSKANVLYELDGKPALALYKDYLGERASGLPATGLLYPLALRGGASDTKRLVRTILAVDESTQSLTFAGDIPEGSLVQLMQANFDRLVQGAGDAALAITDQRHGSEPMLAIAISCVGRRLVLGERTEEEVEATVDMLPKQARQIGFYSYGEISPYASGSCDLHNQTMTLTTIHEV
ncbi:MAG: hypothetical protein HOP32_16790 [Nitrospira sp.]|nr:hypothetical protein [Nitrospira sp.]